MRENPADEAALLEAPFENDLILYLAGDERVYKMAHWPDPGGALGVDGRVEEAQARAIFIWLVARWTLIGLMLFTALVQLIDASVDVATGRASLLPILLIVAVAFVAGALRLAVQPRRAFTLTKALDSL